MYTARLVYLDEKSRKEKKENERIVYTFVCLYIDICVY